MKKQKFKLSEYLKNNHTQGKLLLEHVHGYFKMLRDFFTKLP